MSSPGGIVVTQDLAAFFHAEVEGALCRLKWRPPESSCAYLVHLLCDFSRQDAPQSRARGTPLALMYSRAQELSLFDRLPVWREMGDVALYTSGFFTDSIERELVDIDYYIAMGGSAYGRLAHDLAATARGRKMSRMYAEMAKEFIGLVDVLAEVAARARAKSPGDQDLLRLYDRWTRTGSERIRRQLRERGLLPTPDLPVAFDQ